MTKYARLLAVVVATATLTACGEQAEVESPTDALPSIERSSDELAEGTVSGPEASQQAVTAEMLDGVEPSQFAPATFSETGWEDNQVKVRFTGAEYRINEDKLYGYDKIDVFKLNYEVTNTSDEVIKSSVLHPRLTRTATYSNGAELSMRPWANPNTPVPPNRGIEVAPGETVEWYFEWEVLPGAETVSLAPRAAYLPEKGEDFTTLTFTLSE